ncbi:MAG: hypothetical protein IPK02_02200 [Candidatus Accumulibacter sp.]|uniref:Uncharacterized protein n=1 Tax=Candidatus Accumulibacter affinis TaxID=2954384 RepID=A0A935W3B5_9PROT|nr:hypothetical protein [Candidatus Accumulibacter affinis]
MKRLRAGCWLLALLSGCGSVDWHAPPRADGGAADYSFTQSPNPTISLSPPQAVALVGAAAYAVDYASQAAYLGPLAAAAVAAYVVYDPLAPNWTIEERILDRDTYRLSMRAKSFRTGGDGESGLILKRRALQLQRERGFPAYRILDYSEGVESSTPFTHRFAEGVIQLVRADPAAGRP